VHRFVLALLEHLDEPAPTRDLVLCRLVELGAELGERLDLAILRQATCFIALTCAAPPTRLTELPTLIAGRTPEKNRSLSR
jgi:hypothetical protein